MTNDHAASQRFMREVDSGLHIFFEPVREFYQLESLWSAGAELSLELPEEPGS